MKSLASGRIGVLIIGDEILFGRRTDAHMQKAIGLLAERGLSLSWAYYLGDDEESLVRAFRNIRNDGDICFSFGGIGATPDDRTRRAVAIAHDVSLYRHPDAVREIEQHLGERAYPKPILLAELPRGSEIIVNPFNRMPGFSMGDIHCLPGFPEMAWPMMQTLLDGRYRSLHGQKPLQFTMLVEGVREGRLIEPMEKLQARYPLVKISSLPRFLEDGGSQVEMGVRGPVEEATHAWEALQDLLDAEGIPYRKLPFA